MSPELQYLLTSGAWSLGGLVTGYMIGRLDRELRDIKRLLRGQKGGDGDDA